jgi:acyl-coenzyme A thioesterase PaaI-like protein
VSLRDVTLGCDFVQDLAGELLVEARRQHDGATAWQYEFRVTHAGKLLAQGRSTVSVARRA